MLGRVEHPSGLVYRSRHPGVSQHLSYGSALAEWVPHSSPVLRRVRVTQTTFPSNFDESYSYDADNNLTVSGSALNAAFNFKLSSFDWLE